MITMILVIIYNIV